MRNWKTTLVGLLSAVFLALQPSIKTGTFDFKKDWPSLVSAALVAAFGFLAKDFNVTGNPAKTIGEDAPVNPQPNAPKNP